MYERRHEPLISREEYLRRIVRSGGVAFAVVLAALFLGVPGTIGSKGSRGSTRSSTPR